MSAKALNAGIQVELVTACPPCFLDEPFEGVAPVLSQRLVKAVQELAEAEQGLSVLVCESEFKWARLLATKTYVIERGETVEETAPPAATAP